MLVLLVHSIVQYCRSSQTGRRAGEGQQKTILFLRRRGQVTILAAIRIPPLPGVTPQRELVSRTIIVNGGSISPIVQNRLYCDDWQDADFVSQTSVPIFV